MVQILPKETGWADAFEAVGKGVSHGYQNRADEMALQKAIGGLGENPTPRQILDAVTGTKTYSPQSKQNLFKNYLGAAEFEELQKKNKTARELASAKNSINDAKNKAMEDKTNSERIAADTLIDQLNVEPDLKQKFKGNLPLAQASDLYKHQITAGEKLTPLDKKVQEKQAEDYIELTKEIPKLQTTVENVKYVEELAKKLGFFGPLKGFLNTESAAELNAASFPLIEPIVKMFNPSGPIATQKLKIIQDKYQIKATDAPWSIPGKIKALERFAKQALSRAQERMKLYEQYKGNPPKDAMKQFDKESETLGDAMLDYDLAGEEAPKGSLPEQVTKDVERLKGKTITSPDGQKYYSDGVRWLKK